MLFNSLIYPAFLCFVVSIHWCLRAQRARNLLLLLASYVFYGWWDYRFLGLLWISSAVGYFAGLCLNKDIGPRARKTVLLLSLLCHLGLLVSFKYLGFFSDSLKSVLGTLGILADWPTLNVLLPVGISFYVFQAMGYTIDVYNTRSLVCRDPLRFFLFAGFFPQLLAGPIGRASHLLPQLESRRGFVESSFIRGLRYILWGYFLKSVVADNLSGIVDEVYGNLSAYSSSDLLLATYFFAFQIYGDFAGYSYIAIGTAALFGVELMQNFRSPYLSGSVRDFWQRWNISLSSWFKDYVYIFWLGGNRKSRPRQIFNVLSTFTLSGLWHGANWNFLVWGALNGGLYFVRQPFRRVNRLGSLLNGLVCFHLICLGWVFFRANSASDAVTVISRVLDVRLLFSWPDLLSGHFFGTLLIPIIVVLEFAQRAYDIPINFVRLNRALRYSLYYIFILILFFCGNFNRRPFIYFQF